MQSHQNKFNDAPFEIKTTESLINCLNEINVTDVIGNYIFSQFAADVQTTASDTNNFSLVLGTATQHPDSCTLQQSISNSAYFCSLLEGELRLIIWGEYPQK